MSTILFSYMLQQLCIDKFFYPYKSIISNQRNTFTGEQETFMTHDSYNELSSYNLILAH